MHAEANDAAFEANEFRSEVLLKERLRRTVTSEWSRHHILT